MPVPSARERALDALLRTVQHKLFTAPVGCIVCGQPITVQSIGGQTISHGACEHATREDVSLAAMAKARERVRIEQLITRELQLVPARPPSPLQHVYTATLTEGPNIGRLEWVEGAPIFALLSHSLRIGFHVKQLEAISNATAALLELVMESCPDQLLNNDSDDADSYRDRDDN